MVIEQELVLIRYDLVYFNLKMKGFKIMKKLFLYCLIPIIILFNTNNIFAEQTNKDYGWECEMINRIGDMRYGNWEPPVPSKQWKVGISVPHFKSPLWIDYAYGAMMECEKLGLEVVNVTATEGYDDLATQITQIEDMVTQGIDILLVGAISYEGNASVVEWARSQGVKAIVGLGQSIKSLAMSGIALSDSYYNGRDLLEWLYKDSGGKAKVAVLCGPAGASFSMDHASGIRDAAAKYDGIEIIIERWSDIGVEQGQSITEDLLSSFPDEIDYIIGTDITGQGAANAVYASGLQDRIKVLETWGTRETLSYVKDGRITALVNPPVVAISRTCAGMAVMHLEDDFDAPVRVYVKPPLITEENVDTINLSELFAPEGWVVPARF